jgi:hypothetical protein
VAAANDVVKVLNGALRYTPDMAAQQLTALYQKFGITNAGRMHKSGPSPDQATTAVVWKLNNNQLEPVQIKLGITDHTTTEVAQVMKGSLNPGDQLVTGSATAAKAASTATKAAPGMGNTGTAGMRGMGR